MQPEFKDSGKISRFRTVDMIISEKIDGTQGQIYIPETESEPVFLGSRNKWITPDDDNAGFASWATKNIDDFRALGPGRHYGEWYGLGIQRRYGLDHKRFAIFNVNRFPEGLPAGLPENVHLVPVLYRGPFDTAKIAEVTEQLYVTGSVAVPGYTSPEGVIIEAARIKWKITDNGDLHKGATQTHKQTVMEAAEKDRLKREKDQSTFAVAMRTVRVNKLVTDQFEIEGMALNGQVFSRTCTQADIGATRQMVARLVEAENANPLCSPTG